MSKPYGKIDTLFQRDDNFKIIPGQFRNPVYGTIDKWVATEKIDGTNIRLHYTALKAGTNNGPRLMTIGGRTDKAQIPAPLNNYLRKEVNHDAAFEIMTVHDLDQMTLYGEGYGAGIQKGGGDYSGDQKFILFDIRVGDVWLTDEAVTENAKKIGIPRVPFVTFNIANEGFTVDLIEADKPTPVSLRDLIAGVEKGFKSFIADDPEKQAEGIVARPVIPLYDQRGNRLILKLKTKDFS